MQRSGSAAWIVAAGLLVACGSTIKTPRTRLSPKQMVEKSKPAIVRIEIRSNGETAGLGTGFGVGAGRIATNYHVILPAEEAVVVLADGARYPVQRVIAVDEARDLAIISIDHPQMPSLPLGDSDRVSAGDPVYAIGNPLGADYTISDGLISAVRMLDAQLKILQITAPISQGSSGGPLLNPYGEVIGVATMFLAEGQNLNFGMPSNYLKPLIALDEGGTPFEQFVKEQREQLAQESAGGGEGKSPRIVRRVPQHEIGYLDGCSDDNLALVMQEIAAAIEKGAPIYNEGDHEACYRIYEGVALKLETRLPDDCHGPRDALGQGLLRAETLEDYTQKAWAMRDAFDGLLDVIIRRLRPAT